mmetsp:Transcript_56824/g.151672  ORF Transcript_56824/g.151672 Transcript_56824/m.151672 type:complete len:212 (+) Transcript_56824:1104-1739(+)
MLTGHFKNIKRSPAFRCVSPGFLDRAFCSEPGSSDRWQPGGCLAIRQSLLCVPPVPRLGSPCALQGLCTWCPPTVSLLARATALDGRQANARSLTTRQLAPHSGPTHCTRTMLRVAAGLCGAKVVRDVQMSASEWTARRLLISITAGDFNSPGDLLTWKSCRFILPNRILPCMFSLILSPWSRTWFQFTQSSCSVKRRCDIRAKIAAALVC